MAISRIEKNRFQISSASDFLQSGRAEILSSFVHEVKQPRSALIESLPRFIDNLIEKLRKPGEPALAKKQTADAPAEQRVDPTEFSLPQVLKEYQILRKIICRFIFEKGSPSITEVEIVNESIDQRIVHAGERYLETSESEKRYREMASLYEMQVRTLDAILSSVPDLNFLIDRDRRLTYANSALLNLWGKTLSEVKGKNLKEIGYPEELIKLHEWQMDEVFRTKKPVRGENAYTGVNGKTAHFENVFVPVIGPEGRVDRIAGASRDVTHRKLTEESLQRSIQNREEVLAVVSHDLRNPLGSILMTAALLGRMPKKDEEFIREKAQKIQLAGERMNEMIEDLLNLAKIEAGHFTLSKREVCGCDVVTESVDIMRAKAEAKKIRIEMIGVEQPFQMSCDHSMVLRVFSNLLSNAIKFTPEHGLIQVIAQDRVEDVLFQVTDTGPGIAEHHIGNIFDRFWQASRTSHLGTGLGLAIAKGIVEAHGGQIWVKSKFGHGATFYFTLPKAHAQKRDEAA